MNENQSQQWLNCFGYFYMTQQTFYKLFNLKEKCSCDMEGKREISRYHERSTTGKVYKCLCKLNDAKNGLFIYIDKSQVELNF